MTGVHNEEELIPYRRCTVTATVPFPAPPAACGPRGIRRPDLSERETEVLLAWLLADSTVNTYIQRVRGKYDAVGRPARTKARLLVRALEDGLLDVDEL